MRTMEDIKKLRAAIVDWHCQNGRAHSHKSILEREADDLAALLAMKLEVLEHQMQGGAVNEIEPEPEPKARLSAKFIRLAMLAAAGAVEEALGERGLANVDSTLDMVQDAADIQLAKGLDSIDKGNYMKAKGETDAQLAMLQEKKNLLDKKLKG